MKIHFPEGKEYEIEAGSRLLDLLNTLDKETVSQVVGAVSGERRFDIHTPLPSDLTEPLRALILTDDDEHVRKIYLHSFSHILAQAVKRVVPEAILAIGPAIENGYYYDFDVPSPFTPEILEQITKEMQKVISERNFFERTELSFDEARESLVKNNEIYKLELLDEIVNRGEKVSFYRDGDFVDLCRGPHMRHTGQVKHFKLLEVAGAYWRGDEKRKMLQRIYGTAFLKKEDLEKHLWKIEEAKKRDHRRLGRDLDLFSATNDLVGSGLVLWHQKGGLIRHLVEDHCKKRHLAAGYDFVYTPHIGRAVLWETSGHLDFYRESMYSSIEIEGQEYFLKPMNCPFHVQIYQSKVRSYRDLPLRFAEWGTVYRWERSGVLHGLTRVRGFTQDDAHLFCRPDQMPEEIDRVLKLCLSILGDFGFADFQLALSTRPEKRVGKDELWDAAESALKGSLERSALPFIVNEGDGAFYGPKIDILFKDAIGRPWQLSTIQFDFNLPERFEMSFIGEDGAQHQPYMIHRALLGSMERLFAILVEHYGGAFPFWLSPVQVMVIPIADRHGEYAASVCEALKQRGLRAELDASKNTLNYRIRNAQTEKVPFMLIAGDREIAENKVALRLRSGEDLGAKTIEEVLALAEQQSRRT